MTCIDFRLDDGPDALVDCTAPTRPTGMCAAQIEHEGNNVLDSSEWLAVSTGSLTLLVAVSRAGGASRGTEAPMFLHLLLGLLRDGDPHHGYDLMSQYRARSGNRASAGSFYRVLARLTARGLVTMGINPPDVDARRIPYQITEKGALLFDEWLVSPCSSEEISERLLFVDRVPQDAMVRLLDRWQEELWLQGKALARLHEDAVHDRSAIESGRLQPLPALLARRMKQIEADLEFLKGFRIEFDAWVHTHTPEAQEAAEPPQKSGRTRRSREGRSR